MDNFIDYLTEYYPKRVWPNHPGSRAILAFKDGCPKAYSHYLNMVHSWIESEVAHAPDPLTHLCCAIPSCSPNNINQISVMAAQLCDRWYFLQDGTQLIRKRYATPSLCRTRFRNTEQFTKSFSISPEVKSKHILLLDDVTTTGKSFVILEQLLLDAGATSVTCLALAKSTYVITGT